MTVLLGSEMLVRTEQAVPPGSVPSGTEQAGSLGQCEAMPSGSVVWGQRRAVPSGQCYGDSAIWGQRRALPSGFTPRGRGRQCRCHVLRSRTHRRGFYPRPHPAAAHARDPAGDLSVRAGRRRSWRGGVSQRRCGGREAPAGLMGCEGGPGGGVGDRREGNASWVALSESCSDLQPGGRCCRRQRQRSPTPPGAASPFDCSRKKKGAGFAGLPFLWATELRPHSTAVPGRPRPAPSPDRASHYYSSQHRRCCSAGLGSLLGFVACSRR